MERYTIPFEPWDKIDFDNASFILNESKEYVQYLSAESDRITDRAFSLLRVLTPLTVVLAGFFLHHIRTEALGVTAALTALSLGMAFYLLYQFYRLTFPRIYMPIGRSPRELESASFYGLDPNLSKDESRISLLMNEIENSANKITFNENQNLFRSDKLKHSMGISWWTLLGFTLIFTVWFLVSPLF